MTINLKGFIVGNGATDWSYDVFPTFPELYKYFNLIPESLYKKFTEHNCTYFFNETLKYGNDSQEICNETWKNMMTLTADLNFYDLYRPKFGLGIDKKTHDLWGRALESPRYGKSILKDGRETTYKRGFSFADYVGAWMKNGATKQSCKQDDNILGDAVSDYFNNQAIKDILHIDDTLYFGNDSTWVQCNNAMNANWH
jgi:hypothetical protein